MTPCNERHAQSEYNLTYNAETVAQYIIKYALSHWKDEAVYEIIDGGMALGLIEAAGNHRYRLTDTLLTQIEVSRSRGDVCL